MQSFVPYYWPKELQLHENTKLFFWNLHTRNFVPSLLPFPGLRELPTTYWGLYRFLSLFYRNFLKQQREYVQLLQSKHAVAFMDESTYSSAAKYLYLPKENIIDFVPVPASVVNNLYIKKEPPAKELLRFCWIGRLCDFKSHILLYTINKLGKVADELDRKFEYHIVGDGSFKEYLKKNIIPNARVQVVFHGALPHDKLDDFLYRHADVVTAMGTSALEGAKLGLPTILLDVCYRKVKGDYCYRFLFQTQNYDLGHEVGENDFLPGNNSLKEMVCRILENYSYYANKSLEYFNENHTLDTVTDKFIEKLSKSELTFGMIDKSFFRKSFFLRVYNRLRGLKS
jgi:glycosyltransferase involved in cell wall biosynthesis